MRLLARNIKHERAWIYMRALCFDMLNVWKAAQKIWFSRQQRAEY